MSLLNKYVLPKDSVDKLVDIFGIIKFGNNELIANIRTDENKLYLLNNQSEMLVILNEFQITKIEVQNNNEQDKKDSETNEQNDGDITLDFDTFFANNESTVTDSIISNHFNELVDNVKTLKPLSDILIYEYPSEYRYLYISGTEEKQFTVRYTDYKLNTEAELSEAINAVLEKVNYILNGNNENTNVEVKKLDELVIEDYNTVQKVLKNSKTDAYIGLNDEGKIKQLIGSVEILFENNNQSDIDTDNNTLLIIQFPKYLTGIDKIKLELYQIQDNTNEENLYILKILTENESMMIFEILKNPDDGLIY